jgi:acetolactate synthase-1/3 small subunit
VKHTLSALLRDHPGALNRAVSLFRRRGFNIDSLAVGASETAGISRMTLVVDAEDIAKVVKQLDRLIDVLQVDVVATTGE